MGKRILIGLLGTEAKHYSSESSKQRVELSTDYRYGAIKRGHIRASSILSPVLLQDVGDPTFCGTIPIISVRRHPVFVHIINVVRLDEIRFSLDHEVVCVPLWAGFRVDGLLLMATDETGHEYRRVGAFRLDHPHQAGRLMYQEKTELRTWEQIPAKIFTTTLRRYQLLCGKAF